MPRKHRKKIILGAVVLLVALLLWALDVRLAIRNYEVNSNKITSPVRLVLVTDLHSCKWGKDQQKLVDAVIEQQPDAVLLGGDIFDDKVPDTNAELFLKGIADLYPCYYVTGNHEYWSGQRDFAVKMEILERYHVTILNGESELLTVGGQSINICGVDDPDAYMVADDPSAVVSFAEQLEQVSTQAQNGHFTVLLSHRPERFVDYVSNGFDLVLSGHAHGGQWRIPLLLNGLYSPNQGLFPQYAGGRYEQDGTIMVVSRGLARESTIVPRIFNRPELVVVDLMPQEVQK